MMTKQQAIEFIKEFFLVTEEYHSNEAKKNNFSLFLYDIWKKRGYTHLTTEDLHTIKELDLSMLGMHCLPEEFGYLDTLESFNISCNDITELPDTLWNLNHLKDLYLGSPVFGGNNITEISPKIKKLQELVVLDISLCDNLTTLPKELLEIDTLLYLRLTQENLCESDIVKTLKEQTKFCVLFEETLSTIQG